MAQNCWNPNHLLISSCVLSSLVLTPGLAPEQTYSILGVAVLAVVVLLVTTAVLIRYKKRHKDAAAHSTDGRNLINLTYSMS